MNAGARVAEERAEDDLKPDGAGDGQGEPPEARVARIVVGRAGSQPPLRREESHRDNESEEELRHRGVDHRQVEREPHHPQPAQQALEGHEGQSAERKPAQPAPGLGEPGPNGQDSRQQSRQHPEQPVPVLGQERRDPPPSRPGVERVVGVVGRGPVRNCETGFDARHKGAPAHEHKCGQGGEHGEPMPPTHVVGGLRDSPCGSRGTIAGTPSQGGIRPATGRGWRLLAWAWVGPEPATPQQEREP